MVDRVSASPGPAGTTALRHLRTVAVVAGSIIFLLALVIVYRNIQQNRVALVDQDFSQLDFIWIAVSGLAYVASLFVTICTWPLVLRALGEPLPLPVAIGIGLTAQIGKYLPGNVAQHFGRAALATRHSVSLAHSGISTIVELASAVMGGGLFIVLCTLINFDLVDRLARSVGLPRLQESALLIPVVVIMALIGAYRMSRKPRWSSLVSIRLWGPSVLALTISFALAGLSFYAMIRGLAGDIDPGYTAAAVIFAMAWLAGFLVPGAPAGLGVRESIVIAFLAGVLGPVPAISCALLHRVLSTALDGIAGLSGSLVLLRESRRHAN